MFEPYAVKVARTVLRRGKGAIPYLVRPAKLLVIIRRRPDLDIDLHKPTTGA